MHLMTMHNKRATNAGGRPALSRRPSILIANADADTRALYRDWLASAGCDVVETSDGHDPLAQALRHPPLRQEPRGSLTYRVGRWLWSRLRV
jgi:hypothetical protein